MTIVYELWDTETKNLVEAFATEAEGLRAVRELLLMNGREWAYTLAFGPSPTERGEGFAGRPSPIGGDELLERIGLLGERRSA